MNKFTLRFRVWREGKYPLCIDPELEANIIDWVQQNPDADEESFARFCLYDAIFKYLYHTLIFLFLSSFVPLHLGVRLKNVVYLPKNCRNLTSLTIRHLSAWLENIGYEQSRYIYENLNSQRNNNRRLPSDDSLEDIFQYALLEAAKPFNFFRNFEANQPSLIGYANSKMKGKIQDKVFGKKYLTITYSGYGLLRKLGTKKRKKALESQGYKEPILSNLLLAWECFYQICTPNSQGKIKPTMEYWQNITNQYNKLRQEHNPIADWQTIQDWIDNYCIPAATNDLSPRVISIHTSNQDTDEKEIDIPDKSLPPEEWLHQQEMNELVKRLVTEFAFAKFIEELKNEDQKLLLLRYGWELKQTDVAEEFEWRTKNRPDNSRVSKIEDRIFRDLGIAILKWLVKSQLHLEEPVVINSQWLKKMQIKSTCEILMQRYYFLLIKSIKVEILIFCNQQLTDDNQEFKNYILEQIVHKNQIHFNVTLPTDGYATNKIYSLLEDLFQNTQY